ncbi:hypothetical protein MMC10_006790 [Thelotrema lepadinum]|nr:hypothetical protein [Thelotrema lepadinum]
MLGSNICFTKTLWRSSLNYSAFIHSVQRRYLSISLEKIKADLLSRKLPLLYDAPTETPSYLLDATLSDFLSPSPLSPFPEPPRRKEHDQVAPLRPGHHLVYFPPGYPLSSLLPDGTDPEQSPGDPYVRRMWAGGRIQFFPFKNPKIYLNGSKSICFERIGDAVAKGREGDEKIFVTIERRFTGTESNSDRLTSSPNDSIQVDTLREVLLEDTECSLIEERDIVFMKENVPQSSASVRPKHVKPAHKPSHSVTLTPSPSLLFRFSALTFNAHRIHLDKLYCRDTEGHRNLLVHGPLSLVLMLEVLDRYLAQQHGTRTSKYFAHQKRAIAEIQYRNLAPLYAEEPMKVCLRDRNQNDFDVWVENKDGGLCVRGIAKTILDDQ